MTLAEIIRAQLATGRPLRVTRALLEALAEPPPPSTYALAREIEDLLGIGPEVPYEQRLRRGVEALRAIVAERDVLRRERGEWRAIAEGYGRERDEARAEVARLTAILDRVEGGTLDHAADAASWEAQCADARADFLRVTAERDEARAERDRERANSRAWHDERCAMRLERDEARAEADAARQSLHDTAGERLLDVVRHQKTVDVLRADLAAAETSLRERTAEREALCERVSAIHDRIATIVDEHCGPELVQDTDALLTTLERRLFEMHRESVGRERDAEERGARWALDRAAQAAGDVVDALRAERICAEARKAGGDE